VLQAAVHVQGAVCEVVQHDRADAQGRRRQSQVLLRQVSESLSLYLSLSLPRSLARSLTRLSPSLSPPLSLSLVDPPTTNGGKRFIALSLLPFVVACGTDSLTRPGSTGTRRTDTR
jgi:hypothetical protein